MQQALWALSGRHPGRGFWKLHHRLRKNGLVINHKRTLRIYRALALNLPRRLKKRVPLPPAWQAAAQLAFARHAGGNGTRRLRAELRAEGHQVGRCAVGCTGTDCGP